MTQIVSPDDVASPEPGAQVSAFIRCRSGRPGWAGVADEFRPSTETEGYRLQRDIYRALADLGRPLAGYKIGCTAPETQEPFGLGEPIYAGIFQDTQAPTLKDALSVPMVESHVECEIALRIGTTPELDETGDIAEEALLASVSAACIACEVVDNRYGQPAPAIGVPTLLADDFLHAGFVLGSWRSDLSVDGLQGLEAIIELDGAVFTEPAPDTLPPLSALRWLVKKLAANGGRLEPGQVVLTGSLLRLVRVREPSALRLAVKGFGQLEASARPEADGAQPAA